MFLVLFVIVKSFKEERFQYHYYSALVYNIEIQNASQAADKANNEYYTEQKRSAGRRFE